jgi:hypothetical protein
MDFIFFHDKYPPFFKKQKEGVQKDRKTQPKENGRVHVGNSLHFPATVLTASGSMGIISAIQHPKCFSSIG